jgi:hypothetical protein
MDWALQYCSQITQFIAADRDLHGMELTVQDRDAIVLVSD